MIIDAHCVEMKYKKDVLLEILVRGKIKHIFNLIIILNIYKMLLR
jgi:hypothetical protein